ncbi:kinase-like domain-containing protein [Suillus occidentalis]|nr:kinase-like domain-containing protein [Suillus occidentalis]
MKAMHRELMVWLKLKHSTIVPLLGTANVESPIPALVSQWMCSGTLYVYLKQAAITVSAKVELIAGVADGLKYLHSENVIHGDLHPANVLVDDSGHPRLTDFGLATIAGDAELQLSVTTTTRTLDPRWRAPEVIGIEHDPERPSFESDIYSFGGIIYFVISGDIPWKEKNSVQICIEMLKRANPVRPDNIPDNHWDVIHKCWSWDPVSRPKAAEVVFFTRTNTTIVALAKDLTGQIFGTINDYVASGAFGNVYRCEWRQPSGTVKVAVKTFRHHVNRASEQDLRVLAKRFQRATAIWAHPVHDNIVTLYGITKEFGPTTALVSQWFPDGTLFRLITEHGTTLTTQSKLKLLHGIASGLYYFHSFPIVHGDITSSNVLVDLKDGQYKACLTDFGLSNVLCGHLKDHTIEGSTVQPGATRWTAPELFRSHEPPSDITTQNDMYSFGCVMFHLLTLVVPWHGIDEYNIVQKILKGEVISRPEISEATSDVTDARWNHIEQCLSVDPSARPSAFMAMKIFKCELEALAGDDVPSTFGPASYVTQTQDLQPSESSQTIAPSQSLTYRPLTTASLQVLLGLAPVNVLLFGETGVEKSSVINLIMGEHVAQTSPDAESCTVQHTSHQLNLGPHNFKLWEVSLIESIGFFKALFTKWRLKKSYKKLYKDDGVHLLLYCMRGSRSQRALIRDYKFFTDIVGSTATMASGIPVAAVVTCLEDYPKDMDGWWAKNKNNLESLGMRFSAHACVTSLPDDPNASPTMRARRHRSEQAIRSLIHNSYPASTESPRAPV